MGPLPPHFAQSLHSLKVRFGPPFLSLRKVLILLRNGVGFPAKSSFKKRRPRAVVRGLSLPLSWVLIKVYRASDMEMPFRVHLVFRGNYPVLCMLTEDVRQSEEPGGLTVMFPRFSSLYSSKEKLCPLHSRISTAGYASTYSSPLQPK